MVVEQQNLGSREGGSQTATMKHPLPNREPFEFNIGKALELRCTSQTEKISCGHCESCCLSHKVAQVKDWFSKAGDISRRRFILGLIRQLNSVDLLQNIISLLQPMLCKDYTYARTRTNPGMHADRASMSGDRALDPILLEKSIAETWYWFKHANYWTKSNFLLAILQNCDGHLLYQVCNQAKTIIGSEKAVFVPRADYEASSVASTKHSYSSENRPELDLMQSAHSEYSKITRDPFTQEAINYDDEIINEDTDEEAETLTIDSVDPTFMVIPHSTRAYAGVSRYKDFISCLPVHLSKYILGLLDQVSLFNALCVSKHWRLLVEEVHQEAHVNQTIREEVMLMQGASSQGANPLYAKDVDVAVPNIHPNSWLAIKTASEEIQTTFKSEVNFQTGYTGYSTRNVIMEERNVYCGSYNVLVMSEEADPHRVMHTDGGRLIVTGSQDRRVRLVDNEMCKEVEPHISGHAGSIRCVALCEKKGFALSGSYDTSIRQWSLETGKCQRIYRGITDTIMCLAVVADRVVAGGKDGKCKIWPVGSKKCWRTFKHRHAILAVAMDEDMCITGCEAGRVKVWDIKSAKVIKRLNGHHGPISAVKFDRWHIVTGSKDGYALCWSAQGNHSRCLAALRHPKEVLCLEFMYLRVITGSADGKLRIWNMLNGQCLRIMRGNSRSDAITGLVAIENRITINTSTNLLVFNFEPVEFDYTLPDDKMPPLVQYSKYSDAPIRSQPYPYIRAQRMKKAGASNAKIIYHDGQLVPEVYYNHETKKPEQIQHSAKSLSQKSLESAKFIQSMGWSDTSLLSTFGQSDRQSTTRNPVATKDPESHSHLYTSYANSIKSASTAVKSHLKPPKGGTTKSKTLSHSGSKSAISVGGFQIGKVESESDQVEELEGDMYRRVSWAFENPLLPQAKELGLADMKSLLRSQMRAKGEVIPPDFIYLTVNHIQASMKPTEAEQNMEWNRREQELALSKRLGRPNSSPGRIDPRTKVPLDEMSLEQLVDGKGEPDTTSDAGSKHSKVSRTSKPKAGPMPQNTTVVTNYKSIPVKPKDLKTMYTRRVKSSIPKGRVIRPHTATVMHSHQVLPVKDFKTRPKSAVTVLQRPVSGKTDDTSMTRTTQASGQFVPKRKSHGYSSSATEISMVPMLMYPSDLNEKIEQIKQKNRASKSGLGTSASDHAIGKVSPYNTPFRTHVDFKLQTHHQVEQQLADIAKDFEIKRKMDAVEADKQAKANWLSKVKQQTVLDRKPPSGKGRPESAQFCV